MKLGSSSFDGTFTGSSWSVGADVPGLEMIATASGYDGGVDDMSAKDKTKDWGHAPHRPRGIYASCIV